MNSGLGIFGYKDLCERFELMFNDIIKNYPKQTNKKEVPRFSATRQANTVVAVARFVRTLDGATTARYV